jgi:protein involved in polysaccharide export with SLBB domain
MKRIIPTAVLLFLAFASIRVVTAQMGNSQVPKAVANSATNASTAGENAESLDTNSEKIPVVRSQGAQRYYESGSGFYSSGRLEEAIEAFKQSTKLQPDDPHAHYMLGMAYSKAKDYKESFESFKRAIRSSPEWPQAHFRFGVISYVLGRKAESDKAYSQLLKLESPLATTLYRILKVNKKQGTLPEGVAANDLSLSQIELVRTASPGKESAKVTLSDSSQAPTTTAESRTAPGGLTPSIKGTPPITNDPPVINEESAELTSIYRIGVGDVLDIRLLNSSTPRSTLYTVVEGGLIDMPIAGGLIAVAGLTVAEVQTILGAELKRRAVEERPRVSVMVRQYYSHSVVITGSVNNPGTKFLRREAVPLYVIMAEAQARSDAGRVTIIRPGRTAVTVELGDPKDLNFQVRHGDMISVTPRPQEFYYIAGRINQPGQKVFQSGITLLQAILAAGGLRGQNENLVEVSREGGDGRLATTKFKLKEIKAGKIQDPRVQPGDRIEVIR